MLTGNEREVWQDKGGDTCADEGKFCKYGLEAVIKIVKKINARSEFRSEFWVSDFQRFLSIGIQVGTVG